MIALIRFYQRAISSRSAPSCRFHPTCSQYGVEAIAKYGAVRGGALVARRLLRCQPFCRGGYDPVP